MVLDETQQIEVVKDALLNDDNGLGLSNSSKAQMDIKKSLFCKITIDAIQQCQQINVKLSCYRCLLQENEMSLLEMITWNVFSSMREQKGCPGNASS